MRLVVDPGVLDQLTRHLESCLPNEGCGFLVGTGDRATRFVPAENVRASSTEFAVDPTALFQLFRRLRRSGEELVAICHSHTSGPARPSARDIREAHYPVLYVVVSLSGEVPEVRAWRISDGEVSEAEIHASC